MPAWPGAGDQIKLAMGPDVIGYEPEVDQNGNPIIGANGKQLEQPVYNPNQRVPALSAGISVRVNVFGAFVLEPYLAYPFNRTDVTKPVFGLGFTPGW